MNAIQVQILLVAGFFVLLVIILDKILTKKHVPKHVRKQVSITVMILGVLLMIATFLVLIQFQSCMM